MFLKKWISETEDKGKRGFLSLCLLRDFTVTISLGNHGVLIILSKCSNYLLITICGKNIAHDKKFYTQENSTSSIIFQEKEYWAQEKNQSKELTKSDFHKSEEIQIENTMFYTSKRKKEELERYQDCSWFQQKTNKEDFISKLSQAEALISPGIELNEFDLSMQFANGDIPPWGDHYLEVFDEDLHFDLDNKKSEKENYVNPSNVTSTYINYDLGEDGASDIYDYDNYAIKKVDSYDKLKNITSTNPADIIPISYQEQLNNSSYRMQNLGIKSEIKEELEVYSPESNKCVMESDDSDLNIGREEVIGVESNDDNEIIDEKSLKALPVEYQTSIIDLEKCVVEKENIFKIDLVKSQLEELPSVIYNQEDIKNGLSFQRTRFENSNESTSSTANKKPELKVEPNKVAFDNTTLGMTAPELYFMDLVNYINNEKLSDYLDASSVIHLEESPMSSVSMPLKESSSNMVAAAPEKALNQYVSQKQTNSCVTTVFSEPEVEKTERSDVNKTSEDLTKSMSIAERIKIGTPRKRSKRYSSDKLKFFEDEDWEDDAQNKDDDYYDDEEDYNYEVLACKRKYHSRSSYSDSVSSRNIRDEKFEDESYRERRDKNNAASRRSRQNKKDKERLMYRSLEEAERKNVALKEKADRLEKLVVSLRQMLLQVVLRKGKDT